MEKAEYELFYLVGELKEAELPRIRGEVEGIVKKHGGEFLPPETSEKRTMSYEIRKEKRGTYVARRFTLPGKGNELSDGKTVEQDATPVELITKELGLHPDVLRALISRAEGLPELVPIARVEYPAARGTGRRDRRDSGRGPRPTEHGPVSGAPTASELAQVPEKKVKDEEPAKEATKEEIDKKLDEVLSGIE